MTRVRLDGEATDASAGLPFVHPALMFGDAVFETLRVRGGRPIALTTHLRRLCGALRALRLGGSGMEEKIWACVRGLASDWDLATEYRLRLWVYPDETRTCGVGVVTISEAWTPPDRATLARGVRVGVSAVPHPGLGRFGKSASYQWAMAARREAHAERLDDMLLCRDGGVVESATATVVWSVGGRWCCVPESLGGLPGTTLEVLRTLGRRFEPTPVTVAELVRADAVVLLSGLRLATGVSELAGRTWSDPDLVATTWREAILELHDLGALP